MARAKKNNNQDTINIKSLPVQAHIGASKYINDDWGTIAFIIPRNQLQLNFIDQELRYNCIYFLIGFDQTTERIYVGQAKKRNNGESVLARLREHDTSKIESYSDIWEWAVVCTGKEDTWSLDDLNALQHAFYNEMPSRNRLNCNNPNSGGANYEAYIDKIRQIKNYITLIGFNIFADIIDDNKQIQITSEVNENTTVEDLQNGLARIPEIITPHRIVKAMVDMLPSEVWNDQTVFLDPACKGGEYLREIYDRLMDCEILQSKYPDEFERSNHILGKQLYGIALSQVSLERTTKKLRGYDHNIRVIKDYIKILEGIRYGRSIKEIINKEFNKDMKIDVVIGNPPYNDTDCTGSSKPIYAYFVNLSFDLGAHYLSFIMPNRWFASPDSVNKECRVKMIGKIKYLRDFEDASILFPGVSIAGGVSYFLVDKNYNGEMVYEDNTGKIQMKHNESFLCRSIQSNLLLNHVKTLTKQYMNENYISTTFFGLTRNVLGRVNRTEEYNILLKSSSFDTYLSINDIPRNIEYIDKYKVAIPYSAMNPKPFIMLPNEICTLTYLVIRFFNTKEEAINCKKYLETNFFKTLFKGLKTKLGSTKENFMCIPIQNFTNNSDIDWSQPISNIDQQLYKKYGLTQEEIDYIEKTIKPMN